ncbi:microtubule or microtubule-binding cytoskeletal protein [Lithospermum erythrorhizon]|uniref:Microtubule or microtubule-binding cytoskeletal protein n=1 Tax=Lithospermum erythrorhizon TaxID=34254 RepID=A0AAV3R4L3_LITER
MAEKLAPEKRHSFIHNGEKVFEWDQTLDEVNMYINLPPNVPKKLFYCKIESKHVEVGIKGNPPYLAHDLTSPVKTDCCFWTLEDETMHITLQKRDIGKTWPSPIVGKGQLDPYATDLEQKRLMLQRFQEEVLISYLFFTELNIVFDPSVPPTLYFPYWILFVSIINYVCPVT